MKSIANTLMSPKSPINEAAARNKLWQPVPILVNKIVSDAI